MGNEGLEFKNCRDCHGTGKGPVKGTICHTCGGSGRTIVLRHKR